MGNNGFNYINTYFNREKIALDLLGIMNDMVNLHG